MACTTVVDEEQYIDSVNLFYDDDMPPTNKNYMEIIEEDDVTDNVLNGTCLNMVSENPNYVADNANQYFPPIPVVGQPCSALTLLVHANVEYSWDA